MSFWKYWLTCDHLAAGYLVVFLVVYAFVSGQFKVCIPLAVFAAVVDLQLDLRSYMREHRPKSSKQDRE